MSMYQLTSNDIVEELKLIQTLNQASDEGKTIIHFQNLYDFSDRMVPPDAKKGSGRENNLKQ